MPKPEPRRAVDTRSQPDHRARWIAAQEAGKAWREASYSDGMDLMFWLTALGAVALAGLLVAAIEYGWW